MTEQNPEQPPVQAPPSAQSASAKPAAEKRFAAYDKAYLKFVGGTHATAKAAREAAKAAGATDVEIREV